MKEGKIKCISCQGTGMFYSIITGHTTCRICEGKGYTKDYDNPWPYSPMPPIKPF